MSRIGNKPVQIPQGIEVTFANGVCEVKKGNQKLTQEISPSIFVEVEEGRVVVSRENDSKPVKALHGLTRALIFNMVHGLDAGFTKTLEINGIGYRAAKDGNKLNLTVGLSHPVAIEEPAGITIEVPKPNLIIVKGADKQLVGEIAARIRAIRPPEPYKGKGIKYSYETIKLKVGKTGAK